MNPQILIALFIALAGFGSAWKVQDWRYEAKEKSHVESQLADLRSKAEADLRRSSNVIDAQNKAVERERSLRADGVALRSSIDSLSAHTATAMREARNSQAACIERVDTLGELFQASAEAYRDLAGEADRHTSDIQALMDAWPK